MAKLPVAFLLLCCSGCAAGAAASAGASALERDDECAAGLGEECALSALQLRAHAGEGQCDNTTKPCPASSKCVSKLDGTWSQCVPTEYSEFRSECVKYSSDFRLQAIKAVNLNCENTKCEGPEWCVRGYLCAQQADGGWSQCISCNKKTFAANCYSWKDSFKVVAQSVCPKNHKCGQSTWGVK
mmetsp:Transcript_10416/g.32589  ORF Transcript_10416/g.32589 Transcript_10416/m.32589 type:complete len:184 (+) Transcript_10416:82-633(+)